MVSASSVRLDLEAETLAPDAAVGSLVAIARGATTRAARIEACRLLGDIAGGAFEATGEATERAAFASRPR